MKIYLASFPEENDPKTYGTLMKKKQKNILFSYYFVKLAKSKKKEGSSK